MPLSYPPWMGAAGHKLLAQLLGIGCAVLYCCCCVAPCRTPFADLPFGPKMHAICNAQYRVSYPELANRDLLDVMQRCLDRDPKTRISLQVQACVGVMLKRHRAHSVCALNTHLSMHALWGAISMKRQTAKIMAKCCMYACCEAVSGHLLCTTICPFSHWSMPISLSNVLCAAPCRSCWIILSCTPTGSQQRQCQPQCCLRSR